MESILIPCPQCGRELRLRDRSLLGRKGKCPKCGHRFILAEPQPDEVEMELVDSTSQSRESRAQPAVGTSARYVPDDEPQPAGPTVPETPDLPFGETEASSVAQLKELKRRRARQTRMIGIAVGGITAVLAVVIGTLVALNTPEKTGPEKPQVDEQYQADKRNLEDNIGRAQAFSPTKGKPIKLLYAPAGARLIFHLHPADWWQKGSTLEEMRYGLGPGVSAWAENKLKEICLYEPQQIEEATIFLLLGARGTPPEVAAVVRLTEEQKKSDLILKFGARRDDSFGRPVYLNEERCYIIHDLQTFSVGPADTAGEMFDAMRIAQPTSVGIEQLIQNTDRDRHFTAIFVPTDLRNFQDVLVPEQTRDFLNLFLDWLGEDVETVAWSVHLDSQDFHSEMLLRNKRVTTPKRLHSEFSEKLDRLPRQVLRAVRMMRPQKAGHVMMIGRFPAMVYGYSAKTLGGIGEDYLQLTTVLPERAGPNLTAGLALTWAESLRTDFTKEPPPQETGPKLPDRVADRLKMDVEIDFRRTPLYAAFNYIGEEIHVQFDLDGDALKAKGMTQNMAQNQELGLVPATKAIHAIISQYEEEGMCIVVNEKQMQVTVTTKDACEKKGLKPFPLKP